MNENFSIELKTNFGFGYVSYFYTRIRYKDIDIIPFSEWVIYRKAQIFEIISYSAKHLLDNESWLGAIQYSKEACNLSLTDEVAFIRKYIIDECESMVSRLEKFLVGNKFAFLNFEQIYTDEHLSGHNLIEFRGEKISGSLAFIGSILQFDKVAEIKDFISRIEECNRTIKPMLTKEIILIEKEVIELNKILFVLKPIYIELDQRNTEFENKRNFLKEQMISGNRFTNLMNFDFELFEKRFNDQNPEYAKFLIQYKEKKDQYDALTNQILSLETTKRNIEIYYEVIDEYFNKENIANSA